MQPSLLYILLVGAVVIVGAFVMPKKKQESNPTAAQSVRNMETALEQFMENMEKDNDDLVKLVASAQQANKQESDKKDDRIAALEQRYEQLQASIVNNSTLVSGSSETSVSIDTSQTHVSRASALEQAAKSTGAKEIDQIHIDDEKVEIDTIHSRYPELFQLYEAGKSIEAIAKKLGMNKGEVQLIIGLAKQEGSFHV